VTARSLLLLLAWPAAALAGNDESIPIGDDAAMAANAVAATVDDGASLFYNPAGLAAAERDQVDVSATATVIRFYRLPQMVTTTAGDSADGNFVEVVSVPSAVSYVRALRPDLRLGVGVFVPESSSSSVDAPVTRGADSFRVSITGSSRLYFGSAGLGWRASPALRLGASLSGIYVSELGVANAWSQTTSGSERALFGIAERFSVTALGVTAAVGAQWAPAPGWRVGVAIRAPALLFLTAVSGSVVEATATTDPPAAEVTSTDLGDASVEVNQIRPLRARLGVAWSSGRTTIMVEGELQPPLEEEDLGVDRALTWNLRAGALLPVGANASVGFGVFTDRSPDAEPRSLLDTRLDYYGASAGLRLGRPHRLAAGERAPSLTFSTTFALRYTYGAGDVGGFQFEVAPAGGSPGDTRPSKAHVHELGLHLGSAVYF
jgi:hypothetical protein